VWREKTRFTCIARRGEKKSSRRREGGNGLIRPADKEHGVSDKETSDGEKPAPKREREEEKIVLRGGEGREDAEENSSAIRRAKRYLGTIAGEGERENPITFSLGVGREKKKRGHPCDRFQEKENVLRHDSTETDAKGSLLESGKDPATFHALARWKKKKRSSSAAGSAEGRRTGPPKPASRAEKEIKSSFFPERGGKESTTITFSFMKTGREKKREPSALLGRNLNAPEGVPDVHDLNKEKRGGF